MRRQTKTGARAPKKSEHWQFTVTLAGIGADKDDAWNDAVEGFTSDPGTTPEKSESKFLERV